MKNDGEDLERLLNDVDLLEDSMENSELLDKILHNEEVEELFEDEVGLSAVIPDAAIKGTFDIAIANGAVAYFVALKLYFSEFCLNRAFFLKYKTEFVPTNSQKAFLYNT